MARIAMLDALLRRQEIDILLVKEVTYHVLNDFQGYTTKYNIGASRRDTAFVARDGINLENIIMSPSGRAMAAKLREIWMITVYAPFGTAMKQERERFLNSELPYLLTGETGHILLDGEFNCILEASETTGGFTYSRALAELVHGLALTDTWQGNPTRKVYTHYSASGATRIDRFYATRELLERKMLVEAIVAPFTDHLAVCLRISIDLPCMRRGRGLWKMDSFVITENACTEKLRTLWGQLQRHKGYFSDLTMWWDRLCKKKIRQVFRREQAGHRRDCCMMENHLYECVYDVLQRPGPSDLTLFALHCLKAKIMRLHSRRLQKILNDNNDADRPDGDQLTICHIFQTKQRRAKRTIYSLRAGTG